MAMLRIIGGGACPDADALEVSLYLPLPTIYRHRQAFVRVEWW